MDDPSLEDFLLSSDERKTPGAQLYLYRTLSLLATEGITGVNQEAISYQGAKRLAVRLGIDSTEKLAAIFRDLGLGELQASIDPETIHVSLSHGELPAKLPRLQGGACELERGLIDGAMELVTGIPVVTSETECWTKGSESCTFEAFFNHAHGNERYLPGPARSNHADHETSISGQAAGSSSRIKSWYMDLAARELARSRRHGRPLSIIYLDIDDLGRVNAEHGRKAGDQIISAVSAALSRSCRVEDFLWYNGEDEFALVLTETDTEAAAVVANRLSTAVISAAENIEFAARISASIGYSTYPSHAEDLTTLLESARSAQYLAKARGKGRAQKAVIEGKQPGVADEAQREVSGARKQEDFAPRRSMTAPEEEDVADLEMIKKPVGFVVAMSGPLLMAGINQIFSAHEEFEILSEVSEPGRLPDVIEDNRPDVVFADMGMAIAGDFAALRLIDEENLPCKFIVFADVVDQEVIKIASDFTIDGIILQSAAPKEIVASIMQAYEGKTVIPDEARSAIKELETQRKLLNELSERELEVLKLVAEGKSNSQIAQDLYITVNTVRFHLANVYQKLNVSNRTEAANCYLKQQADSDSQTRLL